MFFKDRMSDDDHHKWISPPVFIHKQKGNRMSDSNRAIFAMEHGSVVDASLAAQVLQKFVADTEIDILGEEVKYTLPSANRRDIINRIKALLEDGRVTAPTLNTDLIFIMGTYNKNPVLMIVQNADMPGRRYAEYSVEDDDGVSGGVMHLTVSVWSEPDVARSLRVKIDAMFSGVKLSQIRWWYIADGSSRNHDIYLPKPETKLHAEYYPDLGDPYAFIDEYLRSPASVLLLAGPPGTGKTTLLRHMISERNLLAHVIYDESLMEKDAIFQNFLFDKRSDIMVIEDADTILTSREDDGNKIMARFLSVSDGLIKLPNKKLVFTTNISDFGRVDPALLRPGRCFGTVHTRPLNLPEAQAAARVAGVPIPAEKGEYTLAELFNQGFRPKSRRVGFIG